MSLSLEERGAYQTILDLIYDHGGPIADDERLLSAHMRCSMRKWRAIRGELLTKCKIRINRDGLLTNGRAEKELENSAKTSRTLAESGAKGGRTRAENEKKANENNGGDQARLKPALSEAQAILEAIVREEEGSVDKESTGGEPPQIDYQKRAFDLGVEVLGEKGTAAPQARSLVGKWRKVAGDQRLGDLFEQARGKADPVQWVAAAVNNRAGEQDALFRAIDLKYASPSQARG